MMTHTGYRWNRVETRVLQIALIAAAPWIARSAAAQTACASTACPTGYTCETVSAACPQIACVSEPCEPCQPQTTEVCRPARCETDAECGEGMLCVAYEQSTCPTAPACGGSDCPKVDTSSACTTTTESRCTPRWQLPCSADADCGGGFTCVEQTSCTCSGGSAASGSGSSAGTPTPAMEPAKPSAPAEPTPVPSDGSSPPNAGTTPPDCSCEPSGVKACQLTVVACNTDADCAAGLTCQDNPSGTCWADANGDSGCEPADPAKVCVPPAWGFANSGAGLGVPQAAESPSHDGSTATPTSGQPIDGETTDAGGCSIGRSAGAPAPATAFTALLAGLAGSLLLRRRRS